MNAYTGASLRNISRIAIASAALSASLFGLFALPEPAAASSNQQGQQVCSDDLAHKAKNDNKLRAEIIGPGKFKIWNTHETCSFRVGGASYEIPNGEANADTIEEQRLYGHNDFIVAPNTRGREVTFPSPNCATQNDVYYGTHIASFKGGVRYYNTGWNGKDRKLDYAFFNDGMPCTGENQQIPVVPAAAIYPLAGAVTFAASRLVRRRSAGR